MCCICVELLANIEYLAQLNTHTHTSSYTPQTGCLCFESMLLCLYIRICFGRVQYARLCVVGVCVQSTCLIVCYLFFVLIMTVAHAMAIESEFRKCLYK